jgi:hypothetical protein
MMDLRVVFGFLFLLVIATAVTAAAADHQAHDEWLLAKSKEEGVKPLLNSGGGGLLYYKKNYEGWGVFYPRDGAKVMVFYQLFDIFDMLIEESPEPPVPTTVGNISIPAMRIAMYTMVEGDEVEVYSPPEFYGPPNNNNSSNVMTGPFRLRFKFADWYPSNETTLDKQQVSALTCMLCVIDVTTQECIVGETNGCTTQEIQYVRNIYLGMRGSPHALRGEATRIRNEITKSKVQTPDAYNWSERRIYLLNQMAAMEEDRLERGTDEYFFPNDPEQQTEEKIDDDNNNNNNNSSVETPEDMVNDEL